MYRNETTAKTHNKMSGFSLIEVMVSLGLATMIIGVVLAITKMNTDQAARALDQQEYLTLMSELRGILAMPDCGINNLSATLGAVAVPLGANQTFPNIVLSGNGSTFQDTTVFGRLNLKTIIITPWYDKTTQAKNYVYLSDGVPVAAASATQVRAQVEVALTRPSSAVPVKSIELPIFLNLNPAQTSFISCAFGDTVSLAAAACEGMGGDYDYDAGACTLNDLVGDADYCSFDDDCGVTATYQ
jgi:hypothetical protein